MEDMVIDLSHWNPVEDFGEVRAAGIIGVIHKATEGSGYVDDTYHSRRAQAEDEGLLWGAYHFLRPGDMVQQARHFVENAGEIYLYAADHEDPGVSLGDLKEFLAEVEEITGIVPVIYSGHVLKEQMGNGHDAELAHYPLWLAQYGTSPSWPKNTWPKWWIWQHTDSGSCPGIEGDTDLNYYDGTEEELIADWTGEERPERPARPEAAEVIVRLSVEAPPGVRVRVIVNEEEAMSL